MSGDAAATLQSFIMSIIVNVILLASLYAYYCQKTRFIGIPIFMYIACIVFTITSNGVLFYKIWSYRLFGDLYPMYETFMISYAMGIIVGFCEVFSTNRIIAKLSTIMTWWITLIICANTAMLAYSVFVTYKHAL